MEIVRKEVQEVLKAVTILYADDLTRINPKLTQTNDYLSDINVLVANFMATLAINYYANESKSDIPKDVALFIKNLDMTVSGDYDMGVDCIAPDDWYLSTSVTHLKNFFKNADDLRKFNCSSQTLDFLENSISIYNENMVAKFFKDLDKDEIEEGAFDEYNQKFSDTIADLDHINIDGGDVELSDVEPSILVDFLRSNPEMDLMEIMQPSISRVLGNIFSKTKDQDLQMEF